MLYADSLKEVQVSTHSRAEAAALCDLNTAPPLTGFNTQPRGGGCWQKNSVIALLAVFQHTAARRRLPNLQDI